MEGAHICALYLDGRPIAEHWGLVDADRMYLLMPAFEAGELDIYSIGSILLERIFELCIRQGIRILDFTAGTKITRSDGAMAGCPFIGWSKAKEPSARPVRMH